MATASAEAGGAAPAQARQEALARGEASKRAKNEKVEQKRLKAEKKRARKAAGNHCQFYLKHKSRFCGQ